jgi:capsular exopolysaccharide synthesis family protein
VATQFNTVVERLEQTNSAGSGSPVKLTTIQPAQAPAGPSSPQPVLDVGLALVVGLVLGCITAVVRQATDNTVKSGEELSRVSSAALLGTVPWDKSASRETIAIRFETHGRRAEAFRQLKTNMQFVDVDNPPRTIAVTSAVPGEGKTHVAINLAAALAETNARVCLVEMDMRKPTISERLGLVGSVGLTSVLTGQAELDDVLQNAGRNLAVLPCGPVPPNPAELIASERCRQIVDYLAGNVDVVVIDTAPLLPVADGAEISAIADATLLTVRAGKTTVDQIRRATETLSQVGVTPVGAVLSMAQASKSRSSDYYYGGYYAPRTTPTETPARDEAAEPAEEPTPNPAVHQVTS